MRVVILTVFTITILLLVMAHASLTGYITGRVIDNVTFQPIKGAVVTLNDGVMETDENGMFKTKSSGQKVAVRAYGYLRTEQTVTSTPLLISPFYTSPMTIKLVPFKPKALYLSFYGEGSKVIRDSALRLIENTELNALVIDVKGDKGMIPYKSSIPLASQIGAQKIITVKDIKGLIKSFKDKGIYTIARIVVFKDNLLAEARPDLAIRTAGGQIWRDREKLSWVNPSKKEVWDYNISIAVEAAQNGFDEIQFDYVRFPDTKGWSFLWKIPR